MNWHLGVAGGEKTEPASTSRKAGSCVVCKKQPEGKKNREREKKGHNQEELCGPMRQIFVRVAHGLVARRRVTVTEVACWQMETWWPSGRGQVLNQALGVAG